MALVPSCGHAPLGQHGVASYESKRSLGGPKCHLCQCQAALVVDEKSGHPKLTRPLFIVPECGHSLCKRCREKSIEDKYCRVCWPHGNQRSANSSDSPANMSFQMNVMAAGMVTAGLGTLYELKLFGGDPGLPSSSASRGKRMPRKAPVRNAMMIGDNIASTPSMDSLALYCLRCNKKATVICDHCFTILCENCFNYTHFDSKESHQGISISPQSETVSETCPSHRLSLTVRCSTCKLDVCSDCIFEQEHQGHSFEKILKIKKQDSDPISALNSLNKSLENVNSSVEVMNELLVKFECYAQKKSEELNMIFMKLFAKLQVQLREQQTKLNHCAQAKLQELKETRDCFVKIQDYLTSLSRVAADAGWGPNNSHDYNFTRFQELQSAISALPLCATVLHDNMENLVDIKNVDYGKDVSHIGSVSWNDSDIVFPVFSNEVQSAVSTGIFDINPCSILRSRKETQDFVASVTSSTGSSTNLAKMEALSMIKITHLKSPKDFYFIRTEVEAELERLNEKILKMVSDSSANMHRPKSLNDLKFGQFVLARFKMDHRWYRAEIFDDSKKSSGPDSQKLQGECVVVRFVDYGNTAMCVLQDILVPSHQYRLQSIKPLCAHGSLYNVEPRRAPGACKTGKKGEWSKPSVMHFKSMVENRNLIVGKSFLNELSETVELDLYEYIEPRAEIALNGDYPASLSKALVFARYATFEREDVQSLEIRKKYEVPMVSVNDPAGRSLIRAAVTEATSPSEFYCQVLTPEGKQDELLEKINTFIDKFSDNKEYTVWYPYVGMYCLAQFAGVDESVFYYRAKVTKFISYDDITVFFIDFGNTCKVKLRQLKKIPQRFLTCFPNILIQCKLDDVVPLNEKSIPDWSDECKALFRRLILDSYVNLKIVSVSDKADSFGNVYSVNVLKAFRKNEPETDLSHLLIARNLARSVEESQNSLVEGTTTDIFGNGTATEEENFQQSVSVGGQMCRVVVCHVTDPWNFYIRKFTSNEEDPILELENAIEFAVIEGEISEKSPPNTDEILFLRLENEKSCGDSVCIKRCKVLQGSSEETSTDEVKVLLIDEGSTTSAKLGDFLSYTCRTANPILQQPNLALKCELSAICPAGSLDGKWSKNSVEALERLVAENEIYVEPNAQVSGHSGADGGEGVMFKELYHIDPTCPKVAIVRNGTDFVPVSFFLKLNGFAIPNKPLKTRLSTFLENGKNKGKGAVSKPQSNALKPEKRESPSSASAVLSPTTSEKSVSKSNCNSPAGGSNISDISAGAKHKSNASEKSLSGSEDSESDDNLTPTVLFMPKTRSKLKPQISKPVSNAIGSAKTNAVDILELNNSLLEKLEFNSEKLKPKVEPEPSKSNDAKMSAMKMIRFGTESNVSPEPVSEVDPLKHVSFWGTSPDKSGDDSMDSSNVYFDISHHGISEFVFYDEIGDKQLNVPITPDAVYKPCIVPEKCVFPFQFEQFDSDGISFRGRCRDVNPLLSNRINTEVHKFLKDRYKGGGYDESELYPGMAGCGLFPQDNQWYRVEFLARDGDYFLVRFVDFGNEVKCSPDDFIPLPAFIDVPQLYMECFLEGVQFTDKDANAKVHGPYSRKMKEVVLNENHTVFVAIKEMPEETETPKKYPISVYFEDTELRHHLAHQGYLQWAIDTDFSFLRSEEEKKMYETLVQCSIPINFKFLQSLIGETIQVKVLSPVSSNFVMGRVVKPNATVAEFDKFISDINLSMPQVSLRLPGTDEDVGKLVYVYERECLPNLWQRGQIVDAIDPSQSDIPFRFTVYLLDCGHFVSVPVSLSIQNIHNIEDFLQSPAEAVPFVFCPDSEDTTGTRKFEKQQIIEVRVVSVGKVVQCSFNV